MKKRLSLSLLLCTLLLLCACRAQQIVAPISSEAVSPAAEAGPASGSEPAPEDSVIPEESVPDMSFSDEAPASSDAPAPSDTDATPDSPASAASGPSEEVPAASSFETLLLEGTWAEINPRLGLTRKYTFQPDRTVLLEGNSYSGAQSLPYSLDAEAMSVTVEEAGQTIIWKYNADDGYLYGAAEECPYLNYETYLIHNFVPYSAQADEILSSFRAYYLAHHTCDLENEPSDFLTMLQSGAWYLFSPQDSSVEVFTFLPDNTVQIGWRWTLPDQDTGGMENSIYVLPYQVDAEAKTVTMFRNYDETYGTMVWTYQETDDRFNYTFRISPSFLVTVYVQHYLESPTLETLQAAREIWYEYYMQHLIEYPES